MVYPIIDALDAKTNVCLLKMTNISGRNASSYNFPPLLIERYIFGKVKTLDGYNLRGQMDWPKILILKHMRKGKIRLPKQK